MDQLKRIFKVCGYPDEDSWPGMRKLPLANSLNFKSSNYKDASIIEFMGKHHIAENAKSLTSRCRNKKSEQSDLNVERLLELNPRKRPSSSHCLESVYLRDSQVVNLLLYIESANGDRNTMLYRQFKLQMIHYMSMKLSSK